MPNESAEQQAPGPWSLAGGVIALAVLAALAARSFVGAYTVPTGSMEPSLRVGDHILVTPFDGPLRAGVPRRGDVILFRHPDSPGDVFVKRVAGGPGDRLEQHGDTLLINGAPVSTAGPEPVRSGVIPPDSYFVLGDNRDASIDSRHRGLIRHEWILGRARAVFWSSAGSMDDHRALASWPEPSQARSRDSQPARVPRLVR